MNDHTEDVYKMREMVESFAQRRAEDEKRAYPRFMTPEGLTGRIDPGNPSGMLLYRKDRPRGQQHGTASDRHGDGPEGHFAPGGDFEKVSDICILDFSEEGAQVYFRCENPFKITQNRLFFQIGASRLPVWLRWYQISREGNTAGFEFAEARERNQDLAHVLVSLSDRLVSFLIDEYLPKAKKDHAQACVYAYLGILYNLRLRFLETVASFYKAQACAEKCVTSRHHREIMGTLFEFESLRTLHFRQARALGGDKPFNATLEFFMKPYRDHQCGLSGRHQKVCFLENDVMNALMDSIVFWNWSIPPPDELNDRVKPVYKSFLALRSHLPGVFEGAEFDRQFICYSFLIRSVILLKDRLVDVVSSSCPFAGQGRWGEGTAAGTGAGKSGLSVKASDLLGREEFEEIGTPALERKLTETFGSEADVEPAVIHEARRVSGTWRGFPRIDRYLVMGPLILAICFGIAVLMWSKEQPSSETPVRPERSSLQAEAAPGPPAAGVVPRSAEPADGAGVSPEPVVHASGDARGTLRRRAIASIPASGPEQALASAPGSGPALVKEQPSSETTARPERPSLQAEAAPGLTAAAGVPQGAEPADGAGVSPEPAVLASGDARGAAPEQAVASVPGNVPGLANTSVPNPAPNERDDLPGSDRDRTASPVPGDTPDGWAGRFAGSMASISGSGQEPKGEAAGPGEERIAMVGGPQVAMAVPVPSARTSAPEKLKDGAPAAPPGTPLVHDFVVEAIEPSWLQVTIDKGKPWATTLQPGNRFEWKVRDRINLVVGNAGGIRIVWDGQALDPPGNPGQPVRLTLPEPQREPQRKAKSRTRR
ncbi:MAG TPA: DUF4115 domain-containing protein [Syntrophobacter fumaroxidans]|nr:DUF4115 domain-containing protein [Syntrophobacter fumaroxidans]